MNDCYEDFRLNLKYYREKKGWSQVELAVQADSSNGMIGNIESGKAKPSFDLIIRLANALSIHPADLFLRDASHFPDKDSFSDIYKIANELNGLPEIPKKSISNMISEMNFAYTSNNNSK